MINGATGFMTPCAKSNCTRKGDWLRQKGVTGGAVVFVFFVLSLYVS